jgi:transposase InsO family protein
VSGAEIYISLATAKALENCSGPTIRRKAMSGELKWRMSETRGANGKHEREYLLSSLSAEAQMKYATENSALVKTSGNALAPGSLPLFEQAESPAARVVLPEHLESQARERYNAIAHLIDYCSRTNGSRPSLTLGGKKIRNTNDLAAHLAATHKVCESTIWGWYRKFKKGGFNALPDNTRSDAGKSRFFLEHPKAAAFAQVKYLKEGLSFQLVWEALRRDWTKLENKGDPPSYSAVRFLLASIPEGVRTLARVGPEMATRLHTPHIIRGPVPVNQWWVLDHRTLDVICRNVSFDHLESNAAYRLSLTAIFDWGSRKRVGWCFAPTPSSRTIYSALRMAISRYGFPQNFYWDNGKDFLKVADALVDAERLLAKYSVGITHALPRHPRSKPIESWFAADAKRFCPRWRPAYCGSKPSNRPEDCKRAEKEHAEFLAGKRDRSPFPPDAAIIRAMIQFFEEENARPREALDERTPDQVFAEQCPPDSLQIPSARMLDVLLSDRIKLTVQAGGCVQTKRVRYTPTDESLGPMVMREKQKILLLRDPYNLAVATAADPETGEFIADMTWQEFVAQCPNGRITADQISAGMRKARGVQRAFREYDDLMETIAQSQGWKTEGELLLERAGVRTGTDGRVLSAAPGARQPDASAPPRKQLASTFPEPLPDDFGPVRMED